MKKEEKIVEKEVIKEYKPGKRVGKAPDVLNFSGSAIDELRYYFKLYRLYPTDEEVKYYKDLLYNNKDDFWPLIYDIIPMYKKKKKDEMNAENKRLRELLHPKKVKTIKIKVEKPKKVKFIKRLVLIEKVKAKKQPYKSLYKERKALEKKKFNTEILFAEYNNLLRAKSKIKVEFTDSNSQVVLFEGNKECINYIMDTYNVNINKARFLFYSYILNKTTEEPEKFTLTRILPPTKKQLNVRSKPINKFKIELTTEDGIIHHFDFTKDAIQFIVDTFKLKFKAAQRFYYLTLVSENPQPNYKFSAKLIKNKQ